jgi:signal transduction histidine kinase
MSFVDLAALTIHDVKNRLAILAAGAESRGDTDSLRGLLEAAATLTGLLAFYKAENGHLQLDIDARCPVDLAQELVADIRRMSRLDVTCDCAQAPLLWFYDENLVRMVLASAVHNALRFARQRITLTVSEQDDWLVFTVADDGPGYPPAVLAGESADLPMTRDGTGIGLQLARRIAALHVNAGKAGQVDLDNQDGAVFRLLLPK